jgi:hypothetical protein
MASSTSQLILLWGTLTNLRGKAYENGTPGIFVKWQEVTVCVRGSEILPIQGSHGGFPMLGSIEKEDRTDLNIRHGCSWTERGN